MISGRRPRRPDGRFYRERRKGVRFGGGRGGTRGGPGMALVGLVLSLMSKVLRRR